MAAAAAQIPTDGGMKIMSSEQRLSAAPKRLDRISVMRAPVWNDNGRETLRDHQTLPGLPPYLATLWRVVSFSPAFRMKEIPGLETTSVKSFFSSLSGLLFLDFLVAD